MTYLAEAPCHVCTTPTRDRVAVGDGRAAICSDTCAAALAHELGVVAAIDAWLAAIPSEYEHGDPVHGRDGVLEQFRRGDWRHAKDEPTGAVMTSEIPAVPGMERREGFAGPPRDAQGGAR